jgi:SAM-dependent methyltransferase
VKPSEALELIAGAVPHGIGTWADLGAGEGTFTRTLIEQLGPGSRIYAVDRDRRALTMLERWATKNRAPVIAVIADFTGPFDLPDAPVAGLDGVLLANALHFVRDPAPILERIAGRMRPGGRLVIVEYDRRDPNPWVPHPIDAQRLPGLLASAGFSVPTITTRRPSAFGGDLYVAVAHTRGGAEADS